MGLEVGRGNTDLDRFEDRQVGASYWVRLRQKIIEEWIRPGQLGQLGINRL